MGYWRYNASKTALTTPKTLQNEGPIEVPKTLPQASLEDRVKALEDLAGKLVAQVNSLKSTSTQSKSSSSDTQLNTMDTSITELKARVSALEKGTTATTQNLATKTPVYIPLGSGGQINSQQDWTSLTTFQASIDPSQYSGYTNAQLQVNMRLNQPGGTLYARLYNLTDNSVISSEVSSTSTSSSLVTSAGFSFSSGSKTYILQAKSSTGTQAFLDTATLKINF